MKTRLLFLVFCLQLPAILFAQNPVPLEQKYALRKAPSEVVLSKDRAQIEQINAAPGLSLQPFKFSKKVGDTWTFTCWFKVSDADLLKSAAYNTETPMTIAVIGTPDNAQRMILRLSKNLLTVSTTNDSGKNWTTFHGSIPVEAGKWQFLAVTKNAEQTQAYINANFAGGSPRIPDLPEMNMVIYGRAGPQRFFLGEIWQPRIYRETFGGDQIEQLYASPRPSGAKQEPLAAAIPPHPKTFAVYPTLQVVGNEVHTLIDHLDLGATVLEDPKKPDQKALLVAGYALHYFGSRAALFRQVGMVAGKLPIYDRGVSLNNLHGQHFRALRHPDGSTHIYARGTNTPFYKENLIHYPLTHFNEQGLPQFGKPRAVQVGGHDFAKAVKSCGGWALADIDGDAIPDLLLSVPKPNSTPGEFVNEGYWPDNLGMWQNKPRENSGPGRGYDIQGNWLGAKTTFQILWAKGKENADGSLSFAATQPVYHNQHGFIAQWKTGERERGLTVIKLGGQDVLLISGDVDNLLALPVTRENGAIILKDARHLLASGPNIHGTYFAHHISLLDSKPDGTCRLLLDGNPGHIVLLEGSAIGDFREIGSVQTVGGPVAADTLTTPVRIDWDGDGFPDLITGDSSGFLLLWRGTKDPVTYHAARHLTVNSRPVHHQAGLTGSMQGPNERRWGYLQPTAGDWDDNQSISIITGDITGALNLYRKAPAAARATDLAPPQTFTKDGERYLSAWRTRPAILPAHYNYQGLNLPVLLHLDWDGDLAVAIPESKGSTKIAKVEKLRFKNGEPIRLCGPAGFWGRTKLSVSEWNADGKWHIVLGGHRGGQRSFTNEALPGATPFLLENIGTNDKPVFKALRSIRLKDDTPIDLGIHNASVYPTNLGSPEGSPPDLIIGAEDGKIYYFKRSDLK